MIFGISGVARCGVLVVPVKNKLLVDIELLERTVAVLTLLGKYSNNGIDTKIDAIELAEKLNYILNTIK